MTDYEYELRQGDEVVATGHLQLERTPAPGETFRLGSRNVRVLEVLQLIARSRLILVV